jgi:hypothetical protein
MAGRCNTFVYLCTHGPNIITFLTDLGIANERRWLWVEEDGTFRKARAIKSGDRVKEADARKSPR